MKIKPVHTEDPLARNKRSASLKPLAGDDFRGTLAALAPSRPPPNRRPRGAPCPTPRSSPSYNPCPPIRWSAASRASPSRSTPCVPPPPRRWSRWPTATRTSPPACPGTTPRTDAHDKVTETARKLVAQTFYGTLLKQMRNSPFKSEMFEGGRGGQAFSPLLDQHLAEHMTRPPTDNHLVNAIARKLEGKAAYQQHQLSAARRTARSIPNTRTPNVATSLRA